MSELTRPEAVRRLAPPYTSQVRHLSPAEARELYEYIARMEEERDHFRDLVTAITTVKRKEAQ
jgi:hypothetical protein